MKLTLRSVSLLSLAAFSVAAQAQLSYSSDESLFDATYPGATLVNFNGLADTSYTALEIANGVDFGPFKVQAIGARSGDLRISNGRLLVFADGLFGTTSFKFIFDSPAVAMGLDLRGVNDEGLTFGSGGSFKNTQPGQPVSGDFFAGLTETTGTMTSLTVEPTGSSLDNYQIDNVRVAAPVPEPASMAALGLGALGLLKRRKKA